MHYIEPLVDLLLVFHVNSWYLQYDWSPYTFTRRWYHQLHGFPFWWLLFIRTNACLVRPFTHYISSDCAVKNNQSSTKATSWSKDWKRMIKGIRIFASLFLLRTLGDSETTNMVPGANKKPGNLSIEYLWTYIARAAIPNFKSGKVSHSNESPPTHPALDKTETLFIQSFFLLLLPVERVISECWKKVSTTHYPEKTSSNYPPVLATHW